MQENQEAETEEKAKKRKSFGFSCFLVFVFSCFLIFFSFFFLLSGCAFFIVLFFFYFFIFSVFSFSSLLECCGVDEVLLMGDSRKVPEGRRENEFDHRTFKWVFY